MSDKDMIIRGCEYWIKNHKGEQLILEYTAVEDLLAVLKEQEEEIHALQIALDTKMMKERMKTRTAGANEIPLKW